MQEDAYDADEKPDDEDVYNYPVYPRASLVKKSSRRPREKDRDAMDYALE